LRPWLVTHARSLRQSDLAGRILVGVADTLRECNGRVCPKWPVVQRVDVDFVQPLLLISAVVALRTRVGGCVFRSARSAEEPASLRLTAGLDHIREVVCDHGGYSGCVTVLSRFGHGMSFCHFAPRSDVVPLRFGILGLVHPLLCEINGEWKVDLEGQCCRRD